MLIELGVVFRNDQVEAFAGVFNFDQLQYLHVVFIDFRRHRKRTDVDNVNVWIFAREDSHDLRVLLLLQLCDRHAFEVADGVGVYVDLHALHLFNFWPAALELCLHLSPHVHRLVVDLIDLHLRRLFQLVQSELTLDNSGFFH